MRRLPLAILCLSTLLLASCGDVGPQGKNMKGQLEDAGSSQAAQSSAPKETMKTYTSEKFGITFQYPASWKINDSQGNRQMTGSDIVIQIPGKEETHEGITIEKAKGLTAKNAAHRLEKRHVGPFTEMTVGGEQATKASLTKFAISYIFVRHGDFIYEFSTTGPLLSEGVIDSVKFTS